MSNSDKISRFWLLQFFFYVTANTNVICNNFQGGVGDESINVSQ